MPLPSRPTSTPPAASPGTSGSRHSSSALDSDFGFRISNFRHAPRRGFTLTEILVVIVIIVLIIGMAVPALRFITGSRSQAGAANMISAMLARARNDAIGLQLPTGVCIYTDITGRTRMAEVQQVQTPQVYSTTAGYAVGTYVNNGAGNYVCVQDISPNSSTDIGNTTYWRALLASQTTTLNNGNLFDQVVNTDAEALPTGVGSQLLNDTLGSPATTDRYIHDGAVIFDADGRLITQGYVINEYGPIGRAAGFPSLPAGDIANNTAGMDGLLYSSVGLVTYDGEAYAAKGYSSIDPIYSTTSPYSSNTLEQSAESWLDANATPLLVNRYNGTLMNNQ